MSIPVPISVLVVDDHDTLRARIVAALDNEPETTVIGQATNGVEAVEKTEILTPDVVVMDISMPLMDGLVAAEQITASKHPAKVLIISNYEEEDYIRTCMKAGASGYLLKDTLATELPRAIRVVYEGGHFFSPRIAQRIVGFYLKQVATVESQ